MVKNGDDIKGYVGQSNNIVKRIQRHFSKRGKFKHGTKYGKEIIHKMKGSTKQEREIYEQFVILRKYGGQINPSKNSLAKLLNKVNPYGGRANLKSTKGLDEFLKKAEEVAKKYKLPTKFEPPNF